MKYGIYLRGAGLVFASDSGADASRQWARLTLESTEGYEWMGPITGMNIEIISRARAVAAGDLAVSHRERTRRGAAIKAGH